VLLLQSFDREWVLPFVACLRNGANVAEADIGCPLDVLDIAKIAPPDGIRGITAMRRWIRGRRLDLLVTFFRDANIFGTLGGRWAGVPVVSSRRNLGRGYWHTPRELFMLRLLNRMTRAYVANSEAVRAYTIETERVSPESITVIPNAIDLARFRPSAVPILPEQRWRLGLPEGFLIGCVANLRPIKGIDVLVRAVGTSEVLRDQVHLVLVGSGPLEGTLRALSAELGIAERVHFFGMRSDVPDILRVLDMAVLCSHAESSPNAVLEYMATGLPVIATNVGGVPELFSSESVGRMVPSGNPGELARAIELFFESPELRSEMGRRARQHTEAQHSIPAVAEKWMQFFDRVHALSHTVFRPSDEPPVVIKKSAS